MILKSVILLEVTEKYRQKKVTHHYWEVENRQMVLQKSRNYSLYIVLLTSKYIGLISNCSCNLTSCYEFHVTTNITTICVYVATLSNSYR